MLWKRIFPDPFLCTLFWDFSTHTCHSPWLFSVWDLMLRCLPFSEWLWTSPKSIIISIDYQFLDFRVYVVRAFARVRYFIVRHVVDVVFSEEVNGNDPGTRTDHLVDPPAVLEDFHSFLFVHHDLAFLLNGLFVATHAHDQVRVREQLLGLLQHFRVADVEHVEHPVCVHSHWVRGVCPVRL